MHNIYIDNNGNKFDGNTCDVSGMTLCQLDVEDKPYSYYNLDGTPDTATIDAEEEVRVHEEWKAARDLAVKELTVTTTIGNVFDGDETSQTRMARAIQGIQGGFNGTTINWKLADNTIVVVDEAELTEALTKAGLAQEALWFPQ